MRHRLPVISLAIAMLVAVAAGALSTSSDRSITAQVADQVTVDNSQSNGAATGLILDQSGWPIASVAIRNEHTFWLKSSVLSNVGVVYAYDNTWANFGYIAPGGEARYELTFDGDAISYIQYFLNAGQTQDGSPSADVITAIERTLNVVLIALGGTKRF